MAAEIINLRRARKSKARSDKELQAAANREKFGTPRQVRGLDEAQTKLRERRLDGARRQSQPTAHPVEHDE